MSSEFPISLSNARRSALRYYLGAFTALIELPMIQLFPICPLCHQPWTSNDLCPNFAQCQLGRVVIGDTYEHIERTFANPGSRLFWDENGCEYAFENEPSYQFAPGVIPYDIVEDRLRRLLILL